MPVSLRRSEEFEHADGRLCVEVSGGLVADEKHRVAGKGAGDGNALCLPVAVGGEASAAWPWAWA